jgi:hypothetical protein
LQYVMRLDRAQNLAGFRINLSGLNRVLDD